MLEGRGSIIKQEEKVLLYFPKDVSSDSQFPFTATTAVTIKIDARNKRVIVIND